MVLERQHVSQENASPEHNCRSSNIKRVRAPPAIYRPPAARRLENVSSQSEPKSEAASKPEKTKTGTRQRRPDIQVYVPRAKRASMVEQEATEALAPSLENSPEQGHSSSTVKRNSREVASKCPSFHESLTTKKELLDSPSTPVKGGNGQITVNELVCLKGEKKQKQHHSEVSLCENSSYEIKVNEKCDSISVVEDSSKGCVENNACVNSSCEKNIVQEERHSGGNGLASCVTELVSDNSNTKVGSGNSGKDATSSIKFHKSSSLAFDGGNSDVDIHDCVSAKLVCVPNCESEKVTEQSRCDELLETGDRTVSAHMPKKDVMNENADLRNQEEHNRKNKLILRGNFVSDVLIISDPEPLPQTVPPPSPKESPEKCESDIRKEKSRHKSTSVLDEGRDEASTKPLPNLNPNECTWDMLFDDNGDCLDPKLMEELTRSVGSVAIEKPQSNYDRYVTKTEINLPGGDSEFSHVVEIYNFPPEFKTQDLLAVFSPYKNGGFEIKWVDDTHALGVFSSSRVAADVLAYDHPFVKTRPLCEATPESRLKARRSAEFLQPYKTRPETCAALARRLVTGALGMKMRTSQEEREAERRQLREAREKKRLAAQQQQDAWEGTIRDK